MTWDHHGIVIPLPKYALPKLPSPFTYPFLGKANSQVLNLGPNPKAQGWRNLGDIDCLRV